MLLNDGGSPLLHPIDEDEDDDVQLDEAQKCIRIGTDGKTIELINPLGKGILRIRNSKIPISSNALRF